MWTSAGKLVPLGIPFLRNLFSQYELQGNRPICSTLAYERGLSRKIPLLGLGARRAKKQPSPVAGSRLEARSSSGMGLGHGLHVDSGKIGRSPPGDDDVARPCGCRSSTGAAAHAFRGPIPEALA